MFGFYVTYRGGGIASELRVVATLITRYSHLRSPFMISMKDRKINLNTFEGNSVSADGSDGIIDVVLTLQCRVDMYHLKVDRNTAEPAE